MKGLVAYATITGTATDVANIIGARLMEKGHQVEVKKAAEVKNIDGYDFIVAGSGIRVGKTYKPFDVFVQKFGEKLKAIPTALFVVCLGMKDDTCENRDTTMKALEKQMAIAPKSVGLFAGALDNKKIGPIFAAIMRKMAKGEDPQGDFKDIGKIKAWTDEFSSKLA